METAALLMQTEIAKLLGTMLYLDTSSGQTR